MGSQRCGARGAVGGSVPCSRVSPQSWTIPAGAEIQTQLKSDALSIGPQLPYDGLSLMTSVWVWFMQSLNRYCWLDQMISRGIPSLHRQKEKSWGTELSCHNAGPEAGCQACETKPAQRLFKTSSITFILQLFSSLGRNEDALLRRRQLCHLAGVEFKAVESE